MEEIRHHPVHHPARRPVRIALTGGIGSGKSTALQLFATRGAACLSTDHIVHGLLESSGLRARIAAGLRIAEFPGGAAGRRQLAESVFRHGDRLAALESILFPLVRGEISGWFASSEAEAALADVVEIPMLFEAGMEDLFDRIILITAPVEQRRRRRGGQAGSAFSPRAARQLPEAEKRRRSDLVFDNTGSLDQLAEFVEASMAALTGAGKEEHC